MQNKNHQKRKISARPTHCRRRHQPNWPSKAAKFLYQIWKVHTEGHLTIAILDRQTSMWKEYWFDAEVSEQMLQRCLARIDPTVVELYYCPNPFKSRKRKAHLGLETPYAWADCDVYHPDGYEPKPRISIETSDGSYQALWLFDTAIKAPLAEAYSRKLVTDFGGDKGGHSVTKLLRVPYTRNNKPERNGEAVKLLKFNLSPLSRSRPWLRQIRRSLQDHPNKRRANWASQLSADQVIKKYRKCLPRSILAIAEARQMSPDWRDRSKAIYLIVVELQKARANPAEMVSVLVSNAYFLSKHGPHAGNAWDEVNRILGKLGR